MKVYQDDPAQREARKTITLQACLLERQLPEASKGAQLGSGRTLRGASDSDGCRGELGSLPHPREFIVGVEATLFESADPTEEELIEFYTFRNSAEWRHYSKALQRRGGEATTFQLEGNDDVIQFREWEKRVRYQFDSWVLTNPVVKAELAMTTFVYTAQGLVGSTTAASPTTQSHFLPIV